VLAAAALAVVVLSLGFACADDGHAQSAAELPIPDDTASVVRLLNAVRGVDPLLCEMATRTVDMHGSWSMWGPISGDPLSTDSASAALLDWIQRRHNDPAVVPRLRTAMRDTDPCVRRVAGSFLSRVKHPSAVTALLSGLGDVKPETREVAAYGLGMMDVPAAIDPLMGLLRDDSPRVRRAAAWALGQRDAKRALPSLLELLTRDTDARVRQTAAWAIGSIH
jgi:HEAT repeat protein